MIRQIDAMDWADWAGEWFASVFSDFCGGGVGSRRQQDEREVG